jgi:hypothetical protein
MLVLLSTESRRRAWALYDKTKGIGRVETIRVMPKLSEANRPLYCTCTSTSSYPIHMKDRMP